MWFNRLMPSKYTTCWLAAKGLGLSAFAACAPPASALTIDSLADPTSQGFLWGIVAAVVVSSLLHFAGTAQKVYLMFAALVFWGALALAARGDSPVEFSVLAPGWRAVRGLAAPVALWCLIHLIKMVRTAPEVATVEARVWRWLPVAGAANLALAVVAVWSEVADALLPICTVCILLVTTVASLYGATLAKLNAHWPLALVLGLAAAVLLSVHLTTPIAPVWLTEQALFSTGAVAAASWLANRQRNQAVGAYRAQLLTTENQRLALEKLKTAENALEAKISIRTHELHLAVQRLETLSAQDGLTGVANRRRFDEVLKVECGRAARSRQALSVALIDVDWFGAFNGRYGHERGDACLCKLARVLESGVMRSGDLIARYSGGAFVLLAPDTDANGITSIASYLCQEVFGLELPNADSPYGRVSISVGVATAYSQDGVTPDHLVQRAAAGLAAAKLQGRHRVVAG